MTNQQPDNQIEAIKARADAVTPGPWATWQGDDEWFRSARWSDVPVDKVWNVDIEGKWIARVVWDGADAEFIAHAREDIPTLLTIIAQQQEEIGRLRAALEPFGTSELMAYLKALEESFGAIYDDDMIVTLALEPAYPQGLWFLTAGQIRQTYALLHPQAGQDGATKGDTK